MNGMKLGGVIVGILLILAGGTFALQGAGMLGSGSFMDSNPSYIYIGIALLLIGLGLAIFSFRPSMKQSDSLSKPTSESENTPH